MINFKPPTRCHYCEGKVKLCENKEVYGRNHGKWPYIFLCQNDFCNAYIGCKLNTHTPNGTLADENLRRYRNQAREMFVDTYKHGSLTEGQAYEWLSKKLNIPRTSIRFGFFDKELCQKTLHFCTREIDNDYS